MANRMLRIVKTTPRLLGVCERCNSQFKSDASDLFVEQAEIRSEFDAHKCTALDSSQNALRIVREATEDN
jgi:hypothetical protein